MPDDSYESPLKRNLEDGLEKMGNVVSPRTRKLVEDAIARIDHTNPQQLVAALPSEVAAYYRLAVQRGITLVPLIKHAHESRCDIETIILSHGLIQFSLRGLYVLAWQRALLPKPLTPNELAPFYKHKSRQGDVFPLVEELARNKLIYEGQAARLKEVNALRNQAAHGVIFGEISADALAHGASTAQQAALAMLERFYGWFANPQPLIHLPEPAQPGLNPPTP